MHITGGQVRADLPKIFFPVQAGKRYLLLNIDATNHGSDIEGVGSVSEYALKEPSGNSLTLYNDNDYYGSAPVASLQPGNTAHTMQVYTIDAPVSGQYHLVYTYNSGQEATNTASNSPTQPGTCSFTLP